MAGQPELKAEFERLRVEAHLAKEVLPLAAAAESTAGELPGYARDRLQTKVRQTLGRPAPRKEKSSWRWQWWLVLAPATALIVVLMVVFFHQTEKPVIQVAMLDTTGASRGTGTNLLPVLQELWRGSEVKKFARPSDLENWENSWPLGGKEPAVKIIYDPAAGEVRILGRHGGRRFQKSFPVGDDVTSAFQQARAFVLEQTKR